MDHPPRSPLVADLLDQLRAEEGLLREALTSLADFHTALRRGDLEAVTAAGPRQETLATALSDHHTRQTAVATRLAGTLGLSPAGLTLSILAARLPAADAADVLAARDRLAAVAAQMKEYQRRNAILIHHLRSYFRGVMTALAGADAPVRYGPTGSSSASRAGAMIQARG